MSKVSVVVPTYLRPDYLDRCARSLFRQTRCPDEIVLVSRSDDDATNLRIAELQQELGDCIPLLNPRVDQPGFLPPIQRGIETASGDIIAFLDDDAEAFPDWLERLVSHYADPWVGGVGGRIINYIGSELIPFKPASRVAHLSWYGRSIGNMYKELTFDHPVEADFFMGGNMSFRAQHLRRVVIDPVLNIRQAYMWEFDVAQQVKKMSCRLVFDPLAKANHYNAPRGADCQRVLSEDAIEVANFNTAYLMMKHLTPVGKLAYIIYTLVIGGQGAPGFAYLLRHCSRRSPVEWKRELKSSFKGRAMGVLTYLRISNS